MTNFGNHIANMGLAFDGSIASAFCAANGYTVSEEDAKSWDYWFNRQMVKMECGVGLTCGKAALRTQIEAKGLKTDGKSFRDQLYTFAGMDEAEKLQDEAILEKMNEFYKNNSSKGDIPEGKKRAVSIHPSTESLVAALDGFYADRVQLGEMLRAEQLAKETEKSSTKRQGKNKIAEAGKIDDIEAENKSLMSELEEVSM